MRSISSVDAVREEAVGPIERAENKAGLQGVFRHMVRRDVASLAKPSSAPQSVPSDDCCEVFLVRHGERVDEVRGEEKKAWLASLKDGNEHFDPPLTLRGRAQAASSAHMLRAKLAGTAPVDVIFSSPLQRCVCTAAPFAEAFGVPIQIVHGLGECCAALSSRNTASKSRWNRLLPLENLQRLCPGVSFVNVDSTREAFLGRDSTCLGRLARGRPRIIAVSHRESIRALASHRAGCSARLPTPYTCVAVFRCIWAAHARNAERWRHEGFVDTCNADSFPHHSPVRAEHDPTSAELDTSTAVSQAVTGTFPHHSPVIDDDDDPAAAELDTFTAASGAVMGAQATRSVACSAGTEAIDFHA